MELRDYIKVLRKRWRIVTLLTLLTLAGAAGATLATTPVYQAQTQLFVSTQGGEDASQLLQGSSFTQQRVKSYADIVTSPLVLQPVIERLALPTTPARLAEQVTAEAPLDTVLINVTVSDSSPETARAVAGAIGTTFASVVSELERPAGTAPVRVSVVRSPSLPTAPSSPDLRLNLALGLLVGLALGVGVGVLREVLDTSVKGEADVSSITEAPVLGHIAFDIEATTRPLVTYSDPRSPRAEAFRQLRTNMQFVDAARHPRTLVFTSAVPGEGKSTTTANLAITLAAAGARVCLLEADLRRPRLSGYLGLPNAAGLTSVLIGQADLDDVLQTWGEGDLSVLGSGPIPPNPSELLGSAAMVSTLAELAERFDYVIIDAPPLLPVTDAAVLARVAEGVVLIAGAGKVSRTQLTRAVASLTAVGATVLGVVLNFLPGKGPDAYTYYGGVESLYADDLPASSAETRSGRRSERVRGAR